MEELMLNRTLNSMIMRQEPKFKLSNLDKKLDGTINLSDHIANYSPAMKLQDAIDDIL